jgi:hypothetical protein
VKIQENKIIFEKKDIKNITDKTGNIVTDSNNNNYDTYNEKTPITIKATYMDLEDIKTIYLQYIKKIEEELPEIPTIINGSFPEGFSSKDLVIIYNTDDDNNTYTSSLDIDTLNSIAREYMKNLGHEVDENTIYYQIDSTGRIYVLIKKQEETNYNNEIITLESGEECYKVYIAGSCEIVGFQDNSGGSDFSLELGTGYYYEIENKLYLFNCISARLVYYNADESGFWLNGETEDNIKYFSSQDEYKSSSYYLGIGDGITPSSLPSINDEDDITLCFTAGTMRKLVISDTIETIEYFANIVNATDGIIISSSVKEIGDYAFYGSGISGEITINSPKLEKIGKYAFAEMSNLALLNIDKNEEGYTVFPSSLKTIGEKAFYNSAGLNKIDFTECTSLTVVDTEAFSNCGNLRSVKYL